MLQNATLLRKSAPGPPNSSDDMSLVWRLPRKMHLCRSSSNVPRLPSFLEMLQNPHVLLTFDKVHNPVRLPRETTSERPKVLRPLQFFAFDFEMCFALQRRALFRHLNVQKVVRSWGVLYILTSKCASRHNGVHFFDVATLNCAPNVRCFYLFHWQMCFASQRRALIRHLNFQKWSGPGVFCTFWLRNVLRTTTACNFSSLICPAGSAPAAVASLLSTLRSHKPLEKHSVSRLSYLFAHLDLLSSDLFSFLIFFLLLFSSLTLPISAFHLSILSEVWLLNFLRA